MTTLGLRFLGGLTIYQDSAPLAAFKSQKGQALLCYLALTGKAHARSVLAGLLWPEMPEDNALMSLRTVLNKVNHHLAPHLAVTRQSIAFNQDASFWVDVTEFEAGVTEKSDIGRLQEAVALYQGDFLEGFDLPNAPHFDGWVLAQRARLRQAAQAALHHLVTHFAGQGEHGTAITYARQLLAIEPWQEEAHRELMRLLALSGQRSAALVQYETCRAILAEELAVEPSAETEALYQAIRRGEEGKGGQSGRIRGYELKEKIGEGGYATVYRAHQPAAGREVAVNLLGELDLSRDNMQVLAELTTADQPKPVETPRHNLPLQLSSFVGREREMKEIKRLLSTSRLVTLTGVGGCGKTRLALQTASGLLNTFDNGVWFAELAPLSDATLVPQAVASALDVREVENRPLLTLLLNYLGTRQLLLVLDNCEHVVEAAAQLAETLLHHCPRLQILATSREALNIAGEAAWLVPSLSLPEPGEQTPLEAVRQADAIRLFAERATAVLPGFVLTEDNAAAVEQVCRQLDGMPLAIELAAARVQMLRVEQIAARLDDRFQLLASGSRTALPRHQTLQALIDWSYDLLTPAEQRLLRRISVFAGGFTLAAAEAVGADKEIAGADNNPHPSSLRQAQGRLFSLHPSEVLELLAQLVNKSLVVAAREPGQEARYHLLETIRQYARAKLEEVGEAGPVRDRHLNFFFRLAEEAEPKLFSVEQILWLDRLEAEHDNLRGALGWSLENQDGDLESGLRLATALVGFWIMRSHFREGLRRLDTALAKRHSATPAVQARLLTNAGWLWGEQWKSDPAALLEESLALYGQLHDKAGIARSLCWLGFCTLQFKRDLATATSLLEQSLSLAEEVDDKTLVTSLYDGLAWIAMEKGDYDQATELSARGLTLARELGDRWESARFLSTLGRSARKQRDYVRAAILFQESLALVRELKARRGEGAILNAWGDVARVRRAYEQAAIMYHESLALRREEDDVYGIAIVLRNLGLVALGQGDRPQARSLFRESMALAQEVKDEIQSLFSVWGLARVALAESHTRRAAQLLAAAATLMETFGHKVDPVDRDDYERDVALALTQLGEETFAAAWDEGRAMSLEQAIVYALEEIHSEEPA